MSIPIKKSLPLPDGGAILLCNVDSSDRWTHASDVEHNIYRVDANAVRLWQINAAPSVRPRTPFTDIYFSLEGKLRAFRFDCYEHEVNIETGEAIVVDYRK